jgi:glycosyltransferase involved in cell wall biosynthesis
LKQRLQRQQPRAQVLDLPQGVDLSVFDAGPRRREGLAWRRQAGLLRGPLLGFSAHLNVACQLDFLLQALGPWLLKHPSAHLAVAGGGPDEDGFCSLARSQPWGQQVLFLGSVTPVQAARVLAASDVSVSAYGPSEGNRYRVPMKVAESLALGRPVVSNLVPGLQPLSAFLHVSDLAPGPYGRALDQALRGRRDRSARGQAWVRRHLDWTQVAAGLLRQARALRPALPRGAGERP